ncbi:MAG: acylphosphatase [Clostridia bacterium]|nr:acylphosphatase [Clostridia bacterium]
MRRIENDGDGTVIRRHMTFYGWVQGVGFRYRARHAADLYGCTGWAFFIPSCPIHSARQGITEDTEYDHRPWQRRSEAPWPCPCPVHGCRR